jgi:hypothetical protein
MEEYMKTKLKLMAVPVATAILIFSGGVRANPSQTLRTSQRPCTGCDTRPVAANPNAERFTLESAAQIFASGVMPQLPELEGDWIHVGTVEVPNQPLSFLRNTFDLEGLRNPDGSLQGLMKFTYSGTDRTDFAGHPIPASSSVSLFGLGREAQFREPVVVSNNSNSSAACFSQALNTGDSYLGYECRLLISDHRKMICALKWHDDSSKGAAQEKWHNRVVGYMAYVWSPQGPTRISDVKGCQDSRAALVFCQYAQSIYRFTQFKEIANAKFNAACGGDNILEGIIKFKDGREIKIHRSFLELGWHARCYSD